MALENEIGSKNQSAETQPDQKPANNSPDRDRYRNVPESGGEAGQGISNAEVVTQRSDEDQNGPSDAGIGIESLRKRKEGSWGSGSSLE